MDVKWIKGPVDGRIGVAVPYNQNFNDDLKHSTPSARFREDGRTDAWFFDEEARPDVLPLLEKYYGDLRWQRVAWDIRSASNITIDGARLLSVSRDWWGYYRGFDYQFKIVEEGLSAGGSRKNPRIGGTLTIDILCREGAEFDPAPESVEPVDDPAERPQPNPLAIYSDDMLAAELARRGHDVTADGVEALAVLRRMLAALDKEDGGAAQQALAEARRLVEPKTAVTEA